MVCQQPISCRTIRALDGVGRLGPRVTRVKLKAPMGLLFFWTGAILLRWVSLGPLGPFFVVGAGGYGTTRPSHRLVCAGSERNRVRARRSRVRSRAGRWNAAHLYRPSGRD